MSLNLYSATAKEILKGLWVAGNYSELLTCHHQKIQMTK